MDNIGLSSYTALRILSDELKIIHRKYCLRKSFLYFLKLSFNQGMLRYFAQINACLLMFIIGEFFYNSIFIKYYSLYSVAVVFNTTFITVLNVFLISYRTKSKYNSIYKRICLLIDDIQNIMDMNCFGWTKEEFYPYMKVPFANSVNLQWTYRDGHLVNLPVALLVKSDKILLRPGQLIFINCTIDGNNSSLLVDRFQKEYYPGEIFLSKSLNEPTDMNKHPVNNSLGNTHHIMKKCVLATVKNSTALKQLDELLLKHQRQIKHNFQNNQLTTIPERYVDFSLRGLLSFVFGLVILLFVLKIIIYQIFSLSQPLSSILSHMMLLGLPIQLPLLLAFSLSHSEWSLTNLSVKLQRHREHQKKKDNGSINGYCEKRFSDSMDGLSMKSIPSSDSCSSDDSQATNGPLGVTGHPMVGTKLDCIKAHWNGLFQPDRLVVNLLLTLGNLTSLCCVDKKGILSDPIATPEKLFFYRRKQHRHRSNSLVNVTSSTVNTVAPNKSEMIPLVLSKNEATLEEPSLGTIKRRDMNSLTIDNGVRNEVGARIRAMTHVSSTGSNSNTVCQAATITPSPIILDIYRSSQNPAQLTFDDAKWTRYFSSLKPLGLNILLNNCNPEAGDQYRQFTDTISALFHDSSLHKSIMSHRCICMLSKQIGFNFQEATKPFTLVKSLTLVRQNVVDSANKDHQENLPSRGAGNTAVNERGVHDGHQSSTGAVSTVFMTVVQHNTSNKTAVHRCNQTAEASSRSPNNLQLMSQGSADLLLQLCENYWDGRDIAPLTDADRARILEFYNRNIFHSYCIAFGYSPIIDHDPEQKKVTPRQLIGNIGRRYSVQYRTGAQSSRLSDARVQMSSYQILEKIPEDVIVQLPPLNNNPYDQSSKRDSRDINYESSILNIDNYLGSLKRFSKKLNTVKLQDSQLAASKRNDKSQINATRITGTSKTEGLEVLEDDVYDKYLDKIVRPQIFLGMLALQADQVETDVIDCINKLEQACIRFVFFSTDNQLRSRVFAERLGLESGWNCHISLASEKKEEKIDKSGFTKKEKSPTSQLSNTRLNSSNKKNRHFSKHFRSVSEPNLATNREYYPRAINTPPESSVEQMVHSTTFSVTPAVLEINKNTNTETGHNDVKMPLLSDNPCNNHFTVTCVPASAANAYEHPHHRQSRTNTSASSTDVEDDDQRIGSGNYKHTSYSQDPFDQFPDYKSKLPSGIKSIRPHLEKIDNVPLLVSLFTDCNPEVNQEMMQIMREYGEIICCVGSALAVKNMSVFANHDCSVAFVPNLHRICWRERMKVSESNNQKQSTKTASNQKSSVNCSGDKCGLLQTSHTDPGTMKADNQDKSGYGDRYTDPINIASRIVGLPCGLLLHRDNGFNLMPFISESHRLVNNILAMIAFYCLSCGSFALLYFLIHISTTVIILQSISNHQNLTQTSSTNQNITFVSSTSQNIVFPSPTNQITVFNEQHILYHLYYHLPLLAVLLIFRSDLIGKPLKKPSRKSVKVLTIKQIIRFILVALGRFLPAILLSLSTGIWSIYEMLANQTPLNVTSDVSEAPLYNFNYMGYSVEIWMTVIGDMMFLQLNFYMIIISFFYLTLEKQFWKFNCHKNYIWCIGILFLSLVLLIYLLLKACFSFQPIVYFSLFFIKLYKQLAFSLVGFFIVFLIGAFANIWEMRSLAVEYRLWRLFFNTKLGMYSPV